MNTPKSNIDFSSAHNFNFQVENLFESLNISEQDRITIEKEFYSVAKNIYEKSKEIIDEDVIRLIKLGETNRYNFRSKYTPDREIVNQYFNFIEKYHDGVKIWRLLSAYYDPRKK